MNKSLVACAVLAAFAGAASAQSSITIYGTIDGGLRNQTNTNAAGDSKLSMNSNGTYQSNRIGFKGQEDLGGGNNAHFVLENRFKTATGEIVGGVLFNGGSWVGLGGTWGVLDVGRNLTVAFKTALAYDPFRYKYTGIAPVIGTTAGVLDANSIQYNRTMGAFTARVAYGMGEQAGSTKNGSTRSLGLSYASGAANAGAAYTRKTSVTGLETKHYTLGGGYKFGALRAVVGHANQQDQVLAKADTENKTTWAGLQYRAAPAVEIIGSFYKIRKTQAATPADGKKDLFMLGATYHLSKRTNLYAEIDRSKLSGNMMVFGQTHQTGVSAGVNHVF